MSLKTGNTRMIVLASAAFAAVACFQAAAQAADLVGGYYSPSAKTYREARAVRTTYVRREVRDCQLLRITEPGGSRLVEICFKPIF